MHGLLKYKKFAGIGFWIFLFLGLYGKAFYSVLVPFTHVLDGDSLYWYGAFHYIVESLGNGHFPYWNFFGNGGGPFYFVCSLFRLFDPLMILPVTLVKIFPKMSILHLYFNFSLFREFLYVLGVGILVCRVFKSFWIQVTLAVLASWLFFFQPATPFNRDSVGWTPWLFYFLIQAYTLRSAIYLWLSFYLLGIIIGAASYHVAFTLVFVVLFLLTFSLFQFQSVMRFVREFRKPLLGGSLLCLVLTLPLVSIYVDRQNIFPVSRAYGSRDYFTKVYEETGNADVRVPYSYAFQDESQFGGTFLRFSEFKDTFLNDDPAQPYFLFLLIVFLFAVKAPWKWPVLITVAMSYYFALARLPGYQFLYENVVPFSMVRHTYGFTFPNEIIFVLFAGFGLKKLSEINSGSLRFFIPFCFFLIFLKTLPQTLKEYQSMSVPSGYYIHGMNDIYAPLAKENFARREFKWPNQRKFVQPRPSYLLFEDLLLKESVAITTVLEPSSSHPTEPYTRYWKDPVRYSNRTIHWSAKYLDIYLLGEKNFPAFLDLMGVERGMFQFFPTDRVLSLSKADTKKLLTDFTYEELIEIAPGVPAPAGSFPRLPYSQSRPSPPRDQLPKYHRLTDQYLFLDRKSEETIDSAKEKLQRVMNMSPPLLAATTVNQSDVNSVEVSVQVDRDGYLLFRDSYDPHWSAYVDGKPTRIELANIGFKGVFLSKGSHRVHFRYFPTLFAWSFWLYVAANFSFWLTLLFQFISLPVLKESPNPVGAFKKWFSPVGS